MILAVDGGGTATRAGLYRGGVLLAETTGGPANPVAYGLSRTLETLGELAGRLLPEGEPPEAVFLALAGAAEPSLRDALARETAQRLGTPRVVVTTDLHPLLFANAGRGPGILTIAGTGSSVLGKDVLGGTAHLDPGRIGRAVDPKAVAVEGPHRGFAEGFVSAGRYQGSGLATSDFLRKAGP